MYLFVKQDLFVLYVSVTDTVFICGAGGCGARVFDIQKFERMRQRLESERAERSQTGSDSDTRRELLSLLRVLFTTKFQSVLDVIRHITLH